ncbi:MAG: restriction endonuclease [Desulfatiglans sp.]|nr:restriction endonuclease [Desulfatiglans sp.]
MLEKLKEKGFEILALHHAEAILQHDMPDAVTELESVLSNITLPVEELVKGGGGEGQLTQRMRHALSNLGWKKHIFQIQKIVDGVEKEAISHEIDHVKHFTSGTFALEIEWNNKDPFFDRDLENFKRLHADGVISIGGIITRGISLQNNLKKSIAKFAKKNHIKCTDDLSPYYTPTERQIKNIENSVSSAGSFGDGWANVFVADKFGEATTHWKKLEIRVKRGVGNPCPLLLIGIPGSIVTL